MSEENQEGQKTVVSFIVGLLIGGLLVWAFSGPAVDAPHSEDDNKVEKTDNKSDDKDDEMMDDSNNDDSNDNDSSSPEVKDVVVERVLPVGDGDVSVSDQSAGLSVALEGATYPIKEGWIGVRDYQNEQLSGLLGVVRFSEEQGLVPSEIVLQRATVAGRDYAVVIYTESGDRKFSLVDDVQVDKIFATFTAK